MISYQKRKRKKRWHKWFLGKLSKCKLYFCWRINKNDMAMNENFLLTYQRQTVFLKRPIAFANMWRSKLKTFSCTPSYAHCRANVNLIMQPARTRPWETTQLCRLCTVYEFHVDHICIEDNRETPTNRGLQHILQKKLFLFVLRYWCSQILGLYIETPCASYMHECMCFIDKFNVSLTCLLKFLNEH